MKDFIHQSYASRFERQQHGYRSLAERSRGSRMCGDARLLMAVTSGFATIYFLNVKKKQKEI
jgi:mRNA-degrading endonuclease RelE of RelBE toxin-antitoxin system